MTSIWLLQPQQEGSMLRLIYQEEAPQMHRKRKPYRVAVVNTKWEEWDKAIFSISAYIYILSLRFDACAELLYGFVDLLKAQNRAERNCMTENTHTSRSAFPLILSPKKHWNILVHLDLSGLICRQQSDKKCILSHILGAHISHTF